MQQLSCIFKVALLRTDTQCCTRSISCAGNVIFWVRLDSEELPQPSSFSCLEHSHSCFFFLRSSICWVIILPYAWTIPKKLLNIWRTGFDLQKTQHRCHRGWTIHHTPPCLRSVISWLRLETTIVPWIIAMNGSLSLHPIMIYHGPSWSIVIYHDL